MNAKDIRILRDNSLTCRIDGSLPEESLEAFFLSEIAAQLAEMNERIEDPVARVQLDVHSTLIKNLIKQGDAMASLLARDPAREPFFDAAAKQSIAIWKEIRG